jgi:hypothetical protein
MGYVIKGRLKFAFADGNEELYEADDAYYASPGHVPSSTPGPTSSISAPRPSCRRRSMWYRKTWGLESADDRQAAINANVGQSSSSPTAETVTAPSCAFITRIQDNPGMPKMGRRLSGGRRICIARMVTAVHRETRGEPP